MMLTDPLFCESCEMVEPRLVSDPHRCRLCGQRCCVFLPMTTARTAQVHGRRFVAPTPVDATLKAVRKRRLFYP